MCIDSATKFHLQFSYILGPASEERIHFYAIVLMFGHQGALDTKIYQSGYMESISFRCTHSTILMKNKQINSKKCIMNMSILFICNILNQNISQFDNRQERRQVIKRKMIIEYGPFGDKSFQTQFCSATKNEKSRFVGYICRLSIHKVILQYNIVYIHNLMFEIGLMLSH